MGTSIDAYHWYGTPAFNDPGDEDQVDLIEDIAIKHGLKYGFVGWEDVGYFLYGEGSLTHAYYGSESVMPRTTAQEHEWYGRLKKAVEELNLIHLDSYPEKKILVGDIGWHIGVSAG